MQQVIQTQSEATLEALCTQLQQQRVLRVSVAIMCGMLRRLGLLRNNNRSMPQSASPYVSSKPAQPLASGSLRAISRSWRVWMNRSGAGNDLAGLPSAHG